MDRPFPKTNPSEPGLMAEWSARGIDPETLSFRGETIVSTVVGPEDATLPPLFERLGPGEAPQLSLGETLGEGGMGVVRTATQNVLGRDVAVKMLHPESQQASQLLREGRVTGWLEHPNIIPVYSLGKDEQGRPALVMKRIEGTAWSELLTKAPDGRADPDYLEHHLGILRQVANATEFAHSRGILHRDLKPDNVMVGSFGEVYVVDWGIAVRFDSDKPAGVPHARDIARVEGTPVYLAPEMASGNGPKLGRHSDVYLLGATLHHVLTGEPPHGGTTIQQMLFRAFESTPATYAEGTPRELVAIAHRAMAKEPAHRFESAADFAHALQEYLATRGSVALSEEAARRAAELERAAESGREGDVETLFHEARFGFEQALRAWPGNTVAEHGRRALIERMIAFEATRGGVRVARVLLRQHPDPPAALVAAVDEMERGVRERGERLAKLERDVDPRVGLRQRMLRALTATLLGVGSGVLFGQLNRRGIVHVEHIDIGLIAVVLLVFSLSWAWLVRDRLLATESNRRLVLTTSLLYVVSAILFPLLGAAGVRIERAAAIAAVVHGGIWAAALFGPGRAWAPMPLTSLLTAAAIWMFPDYYLELLGMAALPAVIAAQLMRRAAERREPA